MGASTSLSDMDLLAVPGEEVACTVQVANDGTVVDQFTVEVLGPASAWAVVEPELCNLYPGDRAEVRVRFRPPRSPDVAAGTVPFGVRTSSREDPLRGTVEEGTLEIAAFTDLQASLRPRTARGSRRGRFRLVVENLGNVPLVTEVLAEDPDGALAYRVRPSSLRTEPGGAATVRLAAVPVARFVRGPEQRRPVLAQLRSDSGPPVLVQGTYVQRPLLPTWAVPLALALLALTVAAWVLWTTVLRPTVQSAARAAAAAESAEVADAVEQAQETAERAQQKADEAVAADAPGGSGTPRTPSKPAPPGGKSAPPGKPAEPVLDRPVDFRIATEAPPGPRTGPFRTFTTQAQPDRPVDVTDIVLQNPEGDAGMLEIRRGDDVTFRVGLANFRDLDYHWVVPLRFAADDDVVVAVRCENPAPTPCTPAVSFSGRTTAPG